MKECDKKFKEGLDELCNDVRRHYLYFKKIEEAYDKTKECKASLEIGIPHIHDLRVNLSSYSLSYSLKDIAVGSIVKVSNGEERFWVTVKTIHNPNSYITGSISNELLGDYGYDYGDVIGFYLNNILDIEEPKPEDTYKPGDRVFFIKQSLHGNSHEPYRMNCYLGIVKDWAIGSQDRVHLVHSGLDKVLCTFDSSFNVMDLETLDSDVCDSDGVDELIGSKDFSKALIACNANPTMSVYGDITLCPVDEKHFPRLNSIVAKLSKPERKPFNPTGNQVFKEGIG